MAKGKALRDTILIGRVDHAGAAQAAAAFRPLGLAEVPAPGAGAQHFSRGRNLEPLGRGLLGLDTFWTSHKLIQFLLKRAHNIPTAAGGIKSYFGVFRVRTLTRIAPKVLLPGRGFRDRDRFSLQMPSTSLFMAASCRSMDSTNLNCVRHRSRLWPSRCTLK